MLPELEEPIHPAQKKQVLDAIRASGFKVSPSQVAETANLSIFVAGQELNRIATETGAHLEVTANGAITYAFSQGFEQAYALNGPKKVFRRTARVVANAALMVLKTLAFVGIYLLRISFGLMLVASVVALIAVAIAAVMAAMGDNDGGGGDAGGLSLDLSGAADGFSTDAFSSQWTLSYWCFDWLWDWIFFPRYLWGPSYYSYGLFDYYDNSYYGYGSSYNSNDYFISNAEADRRKAEAANISSGKNKKPRTKFLDSCFSLLFGEKDPNQEIEQRRWSDVTRVIRSNHGVVIAEQLSPYFLGNTHNEDWMLPVLLRFNGLPEVTESGNIIYMFPAFMSQPANLLPNGNSSTTASSTTATDQKSDQLRALYAGHLNRQKVINQNVEKKSTIEHYLAENTLKLLPEDGEYEAVYIFVGLAIVLSLANLYCSGSVPFLEPFRPMFYGILGYSSLFIIFPGIRYVLNQFANAGIEERNNKRLDAYARVNNPPTEVERKVHEARSFAIASMSATANEVVYSTNKDLLEQEFEQPLKKTDTRTNLQSLRNL